MGDPIAIFGPTGVGKTAVAIELAELLRARGEDPVAISCDAIQIYRGLTILSGAASERERDRLEHRLIGFVDPREEFSAGRFAELARAEIERARECGRTPILVGGTGLYMRATLADLDLRPPVDPALRAAVAAELAGRGSEALRAELPADVAAAIHPNDHKRISRAIELQRSGIEPPQRGEGLWSAELVFPVSMFGLVIDRVELAERISRRVDGMVAAGVIEEVEEAARQQYSRTATAALGFEQLRNGDIEGVKAAHRRYARRQLTWLRRSRELTEIDVSGRDPGQVATEIAGLLPAPDSRG